MGRNEKLVYFYPRSPCGERRYRPCVPLVGRAISIHALLAESDAPQPPQGESSIKFLSTLSLRRATPPRVIREPTAARFLSTLSLRRATFPHDHIFPLQGYFYPRSPCGERRLCLSLTYDADNDFYPRSPCGERLRSHFRCGMPAQKFLSTLSLRRATPDTAPLPAMCTFLSTLSLRRATSDSDRRNICKQNFYPRSPCGERPMMTYVLT